MIDESLQEHGLVRLLVGLVQDVVGVVLPGGLASIETNTDSRTLRTRDVKSRR